MIDNSQIIDAPRDPRRVMSRGLFEKRRCVRCLRVGDTIAFLNLVVAGLVGWAIFLQYGTMDKTEKTIRLQLAAMEFDERPWVTITTAGYHITKMQPAGATDGSFDVQVSLMNVGKSPAGAVS